MSIIYQRLKKRGQFVLLSKLGNKFITPSFIMLCLKQSVLCPRLQPKQGEAPRLGFTVTKKIGHAVLRNFIRRRLRAAGFRALKEYASDGYDYVVIGRHAAETRQFSDIEKDFRRAFKFFAFEKTETPAPTEAEKKAILFGKNRKRKKK